MMRSADCDNQLAQRTKDMDTPTTVEAAGAQLAAMAAWEKSGGEPYADLKKITQPILVTNGNNDIMTSHRQFVHSQRASPLPNARFQHAGAYTSHVSEFLDRK
jgi:hypothetical protein